ncbi:MAG TPA: histidine kinase dimerization/phospho-acceptor domain-containing protein, partial [Ktedonobacteraceae bacterium]|nr:histidine kinase dimerization/phospho-acceptor domain-containing protein [Ktedonobacteraceae bacterium]
MKVLFGMFAAFRRSVPFSLRLQQAVYYTGAFTIVLILTGAVFYNYLETALEAGVDTALHLRVQQIAGSLEFQHGKIVPVDGTVALPGFGPTPSTQLASPEDLNQETFIRLLDAHGVLLGETPSFRPLDVPVASITQPLRGTPWQGTIATSNDREIRIYSRALVAQGKNVAVIQVGESLVSLHELLHQLVAALFIVGFLVLLACATGSYWLAGRSFAPIKRLAETARKIKADDLHQRVPVPSVRDEVQYLALTFNEMLDSLERSFSQQRRFVADASHELRTPVAAICNKAEVALLRTRSQDEYGRILQSIYTESERLGHLINSLLTLARSDEGQAYFEYELVHLDLIIESVLANAEELAEERRIKLTFDASSSVNLLGDEARLIEVFINLVENALSYTNPGGQVFVQLT